MLQPAPFYEEMIGTMKSSRKQSNFTLFRRPEVCWNEVLTHKVIETRHHCSPVLPDRPMDRQSADLPQDVFKAGRNGSFDFQRIVSTKPSEAWWSPAVYKMNCPAADLVVIMPRSGAA